MDANGRPNGTAANENTGGQILLEAGRDVIIEQELRAFGHWYNGGDVDVSAGENLIIDYQSGTNRPKGSILADGRSESGDGGTVQLNGGNSVTIGGPIDVSGGTGALGGEASGGEVMVRAGCGGVVVDDTVTATGGYSGGTIDIAATGTVSIDSVVDGRAVKDDGGGGAISLVSGGLLAVDANAEVTVYGHAVASHEGDGGTISLEGCWIDLNGAGAMGDGAFVDAAGHRGGVIRLRVRDASDSVGAQRAKLTAESGVLVDAGTPGIRYCESAGAIYVDRNDAIAALCSGDANRPCTTRQDCDSDGDCLAIGAGLADAAAEWVFSPDVVERSTAALPPCELSCGEAP